MYLHLNLTTVGLRTDACMTLSLHHAVLQRHLDVLTKSVVSHAAVLSSNQRLWWVEGVGFGTNPYSLHVQNPTWQLHTCCDSMRSKMLSRLPLVCRLELVPGSSADSSSSEGPTLTSSRLRRAVLEVPS